MSFNSRLPKRNETTKTSIGKRGSDWRWKFLTSVNKMTATSQTGSIVILWLLIVLRSNEFINLLASNAIIQGLLIFWVAGSKIIFHFCSALWYRTPLFIRQHFTSFDTCCLQNFPLLGNSGLCPLEKPFRTRVTYGLLGAEDRIRLHYTSSRVSSSSEVRFKLVLELTRNLLCTFFSYLLHRGAEWQNTSRSYGMPPINDVSCQTTDSQWMRNLLALWWMKTWRTSTQPGVS